MADLGDKAESGIIKEKPNELEDGQASDYLEVQGLTANHRDYLMQRHGTTQLDPLPECDDEDPLNWPAWKKHINLTLVAFHAMMATFTASSIQIAFALIAMDLHVSMTRATYLTSLVIAIIGVAPLLWMPLANRWGRRPVFLCSLFCSMLGNIGCGLSKSYATMALCRAITAFFICPANAVGSATVVEMYFRAERQKYVGIWALMVTLGIPIAPFLFGFMAQRISYRWIYWVLAITNSVQFVLYVFLGGETRYMRGEAKESGIDGGRATKRRFLHRIDKTPLTLVDFVRPLRLCGYAVVAIPAVAYAMEFLWQIFINVEMPGLFIEKFKLDTQQIGLQYLATIVGGLIGELGGRFVNDRWISNPRKTGAARSSLENSLWIGQFGCALAICGLVVFIIETERAGSSWTIIPVIGIAISSVGNQLVTTILIPYAVECFKQQAGDVGVFITFVRQLWGFTGPFWFTPLLSRIGFAGLSGFSTGTIVVFSMLPIALLQLKGGQWRAKARQS